MRKCNLIVLKMSSKNRVNFECPSCKNSISTNIDRKFCVWCSKEIDKLLRLPIFIDRRVSYHVNGNYLR